MRRESGKRLTASDRQIEIIGKLVDRLGAGAYRDAKRAAGVAWHESFTRLYRMDAETVIGIMQQEAKR